MNPLQGLRAQGQSVWFDDIQRSLIWTGALHRMVTVDGLTGLTSNASIFEKAIAESSDYTAALAALVADGLDPSEAYEQLVVEDMQWACDVLRPVYYETEGRDGFCSLEVSPHLAHEPLETGEEASRLWELVGRENLMIQIPATQAGLTVIPDLIAQGINVNATLLFSVERYQAVHDAYLRGLEELIRAGGDPSTVASVASFFVGRIDALVDSALDDQLAEASSDRRATIESLRGQVGVATAKLAYRSYRQTLEGDRWRALAAEGAQPQRLLWASMRPKDPSFRDVRYVEALIGHDTVASLPSATYDAFRDHGVVAPTLTTDVAAAEATLAGLEAVDIPIAEVTETLEEEGVHAYVESYDRLMGAVQGARAAIMADAQPSMEMRLGSYESAVEACAHALDEDGFVRRLWGHDGSLFGRGVQADDAERFMGWLEIVDVMRDYADHLLHLQDRLEADETESVVVVGMGGSSLAAQVFAQTFGQLDGSPELLVLDSTVPAQIRALEGEITLEETLFIVASKSGTTEEAVAFDAYFFDQVKNPGNFAAITDPGTPLEESAIDLDYMTIFHGDEEIGGRYSALSPFGMVPAAAMGLDTEELLDRAQLMIGSCSPAVPVFENPGVYLGAAIGALAKAGRNKLTLVLSSTIRAFGAWLEQLLAESTGKEGRGVLPVDNEALGTPDKYGDDRLFVHIALEDDDDRSTEVYDKLDALHAAGHPVFTFTLSDPRDITQEMFRWQIATAAMGHVLAVNPFDQPNVQQSKDYTRSLLEAYEDQGAPPRVPDLVLLAEDEGLTVLTDAANAEAIGSPDSVQTALRAHLGRIKPGDYVAFNAFIETTEDTEAALSRIRLSVRDHYRVATTVGFGPRFLHSTGQFHKGGPNNGVFFQLTCDDPEDLPVPGRAYSFSTLKAAQEAGDFMALAEGSRRLLRVHLGADVAAGLDTLARLLTTH